MNIRKIGRCAAKTVIFLYFAIFALLIIVPMLWMLLSSLKTNTEFFSSVWGFPEELMFENYVYAFTNGVGQYFTNSLLYTAASVALSVFFSALAAYALSRFEFRGRNILFVAVMAGMMISPEVNLVSLYSLMQDLNLYDTRIGLILVYTVFRFPFTVVLMRSYMLSLPRSVEEAALLDGCNVMQVFLRIALPMSKPVLASGALFSAMYAWNEYMFATIFIESSELRTIPIGLQSLKTAMRTDYPVLIAGLVISASVTIIAFLCSQKYFIRGLAQGSVKE